MNGWRAGFTNECMLVMYRKKMIMFMIASLLLPMVLAVSLQALQPLIGIVAVSEAFPIQVLGLYTFFWVPLFMLMIVADLFPNEIASRTLKLSLLRPNSRFSVFAAKVLTLIVYMAALLLLLGVVTWLCNVFIGDALTAAAGVRMLKAYSAAFVSMATLGAVFIFLGQFFRSATGYMMFTILLYAAAQVAPFLYHPLTTFAPTSYTDWYMLWLSAAVPTSKLVSTSLYQISSAVLFLALGYYIFDRKEV